MTQYSCICCGQYGEWVETPFRVCPKCMTHVKITSTDEGYQCELLVTHKIITEEIAWNRQ